MQAGIHPYLRARANSRAGRLAHAGKQFSSFLNRNLRRQAHIRTCAGTLIAKIDIAEIKPYLRAGANMHVQTCTHVQICAHVHTSVLAPPRKFKHARRSGTYKRACKHARTHAGRQTHLHVRARTHTLTHTHKHTQCKCKCVRVRVRVRVVCVCVYVCTNHIHTYARAHTPKHRWIWFS